MNTLLTAGHALFNENTLVNESIPHCCGCIAAGAEYKTVPVIWQSLPKVTPEDNRRI